MGIQGVRAGKPLKKPNERYGPVHKKRIAAACVRPRLKFAALAGVLIFLAPAAWSQDDIDPETYDPRFEIMIGGGASNLNSPPDWSGEQYYSATLGITMNLLDWLSLQAGKELSYGSNLIPDWIDYGPHHQLSTSLRPYRDGTWTGGRLDIPLGWMESGHLNIHSILVSFGMFWDDYAIRSTEHRYYVNPYGWQTGDAPELRKQNRNDHVADLSGYYVSLAARWRLDQLRKTSPDSWIGHYGIDAGVRYTTAGESSVRYDTLMPVPSGFAGVQVFVNLFTKIDLLF